MDYSVLLCSRLSLRDCRIATFRTLSDQVDLFCNPTAQIQGRCVHLHPRAAVHPGVLSGVHALLRIHHQRCHQCQRDHLRLRTILRVRLQSQRSALYTRHLHTEQRCVQLSLGDAERVCHLLRGVHTVLDLPFKGTDHAVGPARYRSLSVATVLRQNRGHASLPGGGLVHGIHFSFLFHPKGDHQLDHGRAGARG